jgi:hypothetical protein
VNLTSIHHKIFQLIKWVAVILISIKIFIVKLKCPKEEALR